MRVRRTRKITKTNMGPEVTAEQIIERDAFERDAKGFNEALGALISKYQITIVAKLLHTEDGDKPILRIQRLAKQPEAPVAAPAQVVKKGKNGKKSK